MTSIPIAHAGFSSPFDAAVQTKAKTQDTPGTQSTTTGSNPFSTSNLGSTFLNLLVQELKNQDPTQPMDPTQTVGQLISLNQLDQLISINQTLQPSTSTASTTQPASGAPKHDAVQGLAPAADSPAQTQASQQAALAALQSAQAANSNPAVPLNLNALSNLIGAK